MSNLLQHVAIIMDGNGRWAKQRKLPRVMGHRQGAKGVRKAIKFCLSHRIPTLTLFALSVENFLYRPQKEISALMQLFFESIVSNVSSFCEQGIKLSLIGDLSVLPNTLLCEIDKAKNMTRDCDKMELILAINYSGRWDIFQAANRYNEYCQSHGKIAGEMSEYSAFLSLKDYPDPDLLIRTGGDQRISNFLLWQCAYTEIFFADEFWPDFDEICFQRAIDFYVSSQRRFGKIEVEPCHG